MLLGIVPLVGLLVALILILAIFGLMLVTACGVVYYAIRAAIPIVWTALDSVTAAIRSLGTTFGRWRERGTAYRQAVGSHGKDADIRIKATGGNSANSICRVCDCNVVTDLVICLSCRTSYHRNCWASVGHCSVDGCGEKRCVLVRNRSPAKCV